MKLIKIKTMAWKKKKKIETKKSRNDNLNDKLDFLENIEGNLKEENNNKYIFI